MRVDVWGCGGDKVLLGFLELRVIFNADWTVEWGGGGVGIEWVTGAI